MARNNTGIHIREGGECKRWSADVLSSPGVLTPTTEVPETIVSKCRRTSGIRRWLCMYYGPTALIVFTLMGL